MPLTQEDAERIFRDAGALLDGHFVLSSGLHSARYFEKFRVFERPTLTEQLCAGIVERLPARVDAVAGPATGGMLIAQEVARQLESRALYAERDEMGTGRTFRRGQRVHPGERILVVDDVLTTGHSVRDTIAAVRGRGGAVVGVSVLVDRSGGMELGPALMALWTTRADAIEPDHCSLCARGVPISKPGTASAVSSTR